MQYRIFFWELNICTAEHLNPCFMANYITHLIWLHNYGTIKHYIQMQIFNKFGLKYDF